jgi:putative ABC transport system permease protein
MLESFVRLLNVDLGFRTAGVLRAFVNLPAGRYPDRRVTDLFYDRVDELVRAEPGVASVAFISGLPPERRPNNSSFIADGQAVDMHTGVPPLEFVQFGSPSMFDVLGVPVVRGRAFSAADTQNAAPVAVINERATRAFFQDSDPIGRRMRTMLPGRPWMTIIGVVADMRQNGLTRPAGTELYVPLAQAENASNGNLRNLNVVIRMTGGAPERIADALRKAVVAADSTAALSNIEAMDVTVARTIAAPRFLTWVVGGFAAIALLLAAVGVYGVVSHSVASRTREIGVRRSLGASAPAIGRLIAQDIGRLVLGGLALGILAAVYASRALAPFAFDTAADSPGRIAAVAALLALAALAAGALPLVRALRIDPASALRQ